MSNHIRYTLTPLLFLLMIIVVINLFSRAAQTEQGTVTAVASQPSIAPPTSRPPILPATILPSPTLTPSPRPTALTGNITLLGPPPDSTFLQDGQAAFLWSYSEPLPTEQQFVLTLQQNEETIAVGSLGQPNFGDDYRLFVSFSDLPFVADTAVWQLHLEWMETSTLIQRSEARSLSFLSP